MGRDFERATRGRLERRGYFVIRAALSKGKCDLVAVKSWGKVIAKSTRNGQLVFPGCMVLGVQCKRRGDIGSAEWNALFELCTEFGMTPVVAVKTGERTTGFFRLDEPRVPRRQGRPWTAIDPETAEALPEQLAIA